MEKLNVLIVCSRQETAESAGKKISAMGGKSSYVRQGLNVVPLVQKNSFDLIIIDQILDDEEGIHVGRRIRKEVSLSEIPLLFILSDSSAVPAIAAVPYSDFIETELLELSLSGRLTPYFKMWSEKKRLLALAEGKGELAANLESALTEMEVLYQIDPLTEVLNRRTIIRKIDDEAVRSRRGQKSFALLKANIKGCRRYNENHGWDCGDFIIKAVSRKLVEQTRERDTVSRIDGNEFLILLPETGEEGAVVLAEKIRTWFTGAAFPYGGTVLTVTLVFDWKICSPGDDPSKVLSSFDNESSGK